MVMGLSTSRLSWLNKKRKQNNRTSTSSTTSNTTRIRRSTRTIDLLPAEQEQHHHHRRHRRHQQRRHQLQQQQETSQLSLQVQIPPPNPTASTTTSVTKKLLGFDRRNKMGRWSRRPYQEQMWLSGDIDHNNDNHKTRNMTSTGYSTGSTSAGGASFPFSSARLPNEALKKSYATMSCTSKLTTGISSSNTNASASATNSIIKDDCTSCKSTPTAMSRSTLRSSTTQKVNNKKKQSMTMSQPSPLSSSPSPSLSKMKYQLPYSIQFISLVLPTSFPQPIIDSGITRTDITTDHLNDNDNNHNNNGATSKTAQLLKALLSSSSTNAHHDAYDDDGELDTTTMTSTTTSTDMWSVTSGQTTLAKDRIKETIVCSMEIKQYLDEMTNNNNNNNNDDEDENHYNSMLPAVPNLQHGPVNVDFVLESSEWEIASFVDTFIQLKRFNDVIDIYLTVLEHFQTQFGNVNPMVISTLHNLGVIYVLKGDYARALVYCKEALKRRKQTLGCNHGDLVTSYCELGVIYYAREEFSRGLDALRQALHIVCNSKEYNYPNYKVTFILNNIACLHFACGKSIASIATFEESLDMQRSMMGSTVSNEVSNMLLNMSITLCNAGIVSATQGQDDIASSLVEEGLIVQQSVLHDKHRLVKSTISTLKTMVKHYDDANDDTIPHLCMDQVEISYPQCRNSSDLADDVKNQSLAECSDMLTLGSMQKGELNSQQRVSTAMPYKYLAHQIISEGQSKRHCSWVALDVESSEQKCTDTEEHFNLSESCVMASYKIQVSE